MLMNLDTIVRDEGTVVVFGGQITEDLTDFRRYGVGVDYRMAQDIIDSDEWQAGGPVQVEVEMWQIVGVLA